MKKMLLAMVAVLAMSTSAFAQEKQCKEQCGKCCDTTQVKQDRTDRMVKRYNLTDKQAAKLRKLNEEYADKLPMGRFRGERKDFKLSREEVQKNRAAYEKELKDILGDDVYAKLQQDRKQRRQGFHHRPQRLPGND
ncbi:hypothetical protein [Prevotella sp. kh1p2]|uniref:hypothetical protein n=1 Tax=Prevotella sp. kh1p2 TaxID=1761883 RepID=UPI0008D6E986|nr:hypothetical protein [Prevotella sp. kh1p2]SES62667.1 hypothetical protein SAMN04487825_10147 [Prevotella sp. kh1p2]SNU10207.1 hypothetical protein SAMN06298210_101239 [Prevotellaceae bacterium KH2P17]